MKFPVWPWILVSLLSSLGVAWADANDVPSGHRVALLIGNAEYDEWTLPGVKKSLEHVEKAVEKNGFSVVRRENLGKRDDLKELVEDFAGSVPTNGVALVYFIGLGAHVERGGKFINLLRPTQEKIANENDYRSAGLDVSFVIDTLRKQSGSRTNLIVLDASWESSVHPASQKVLPGLRAFDPGPDTAVLFAAGSGNTISVPANEAVSLLASALATHLGTCDQSIAQACQAIAGNRKRWIGGAKTMRGLGPPPASTIVDAPARANGAGDAFINSTGMVFRWCPAGSFEMGSGQAETAATRDRKPVMVTLSQGFWMGEYEVTQREYRLVTRKNPPVGFTEHKNAPFWGVAEAKSVTEFCKKLNEHETKAGRLPAGWAYACPTEAEWEYACRAGSTTTFSFGEKADGLGRFGNFADHSLRRENPDYYWAHEKADDGVGEALAPVGSYRPNAWGLRDMHGNVSELVADHYLQDLPGGTDPRVNVKKDGRHVIRGGAWCSRAAYCESSFRNFAPSRNKANFIGFRVVLKRGR